MKNTLKYLFAFALFVSTTLAAAATLTSQVDRTTISTNETLELTVNYNGEASSSDLDFSALEKYFELLSSPRFYSQRSWMNGQVEYAQTWTVTLLPKSEGKIAIPPFELGGNTSNSIDITVNKAAYDSASNSDKPVFIEMEMDKASLYVQEQLQITYRLYTSIGLSSAEESFADIENTERLAIKPITYQKQLNGRNFEVAEWRYVVFPTASGTMDIPAFRVSAYSPRSRQYPSGKRFNLFSKTARIEVKPQPANVNGYWLPAVDVKLEEQPIDVNASWRVGEPLTRTITTTATGTSATHLPEIVIPESERYRIYPDQPEFNQTASEDGVVATRSESVAIVPTEPGILTLPPVRLQWWDTRENTLKTAQLPEVTLEVLPASQQSYTPEPVARTRPATIAEPGNNGLFTLSLAANAVLIIIVAILLLRRHKNPATTHSKTDINTHTIQGTAPEKERFAQVRKAAREGDHKQLRESLLRWAVSYWPNQSVTTLDKIGQLVGDTTLRNQLNALDQLLYGREEKDVDGSWIAAQLKRYRANGGSRATNTVKGDLKNLYPT